VIEKDVVPAERDEEKLLAFLLDWRVSLEVGRVRYEAPIGELIGIANGRMFHPGIGAKEADGELRRRGLLVSSTHLYVANTHRAIEIRLRGTSWAAGWSRVLRRIEGAKAHGREYYAGAQSRGTAVPLDLVWSRVKPETVEDGPMKDG
jgi:hypothetical protein